MRFDDETNATAPVDLTRHAEERLRQRGYRERDLAVVLNYGTTCDEAVVLTDADVSRAIAEKKREIPLETVRVRVNDAMSTPITPPCRIPLGAVGPVHVGYVAPSRSSGEEQGRYLALQASDVGPDGTVVWAALSRVTPVFDPSRYLVSEGDVAIPLRTPRPFAAVLRDVPPDAIAVGHMAIVTPHPEIADPDYLAWYINHPRTAARLQGLTRGSKLRFLSITDLREFEIELPALELQRRIAHIHYLHERVTELERQLADARVLMIQSLTMAALSRAMDSSTRE